MHMYVYVFINACGGGYVYPNRYLTLWSIS